MRRDNTPWRPLAAAELSWTDAGDPVSVHFEDVYYSRDNGLQESHYVFLQGNDLPQRWLASSGQRFCIAETGFGTGLNFLLSWQAWLDLPEPRPLLHYLSLEKHPLAPVELARALAAWPSLQPLATQLLAHYPGLLPGQHRLLFDRGRITLDLWWEDAADALADLASRGQPLVDAWYLDGFAPARNATMWQPGMLHSMAVLSRPHASFATFTAAGKVRRGLAEAGFAVEKIPGFGRKRECLRGRLARPAAAQAPTETPWDLTAASLSTGPPATAIVVGAGLAGCTTAAALARRGVAVTLLERDKLAGAGSGNEQGILYTRLSAKHSALSDFALQSFGFAARFYRPLFQHGLLVEGLDGALCGSFHPSDDPQELALMAAALATIPDFARVVDTAEARELSGADQARGGFWFPGSGWLRPPSVCRALAAQPGIRLLEDCGDIHLTASGRSWRAHGRDSLKLEADCAIVATGTDSLGMDLLSRLPLQAIRGQTTHLPTAAGYGELRAALCHEGYIAPARAGVHCIGATFDIDDPDLSLRPRDHRRNLQRLARAVPAWGAALAMLDPAALDGRVAYRCASPDYLPLVGPVPDTPGFLRSFARLRQNARQLINNPGDYVSGLYLTTAHGSRGLTSTPLAAELLASQICGEPAPLSRELCRALAPARFIIRDLSRNRI